MSINYIETEFPIIINLTPDKFHSGMYEELEQAVKKKYSGIAHAKIGYVKPDSVQIVSKQIGKYEGSHLTGNMSFHMIIRCQATMPVRDMKLSAIVTMKNDAGLVCRNFRLPYSLFVPNIPGDEDSELIASINTNDSVEVSIIDSRLKAPNASDRNKPEYWVICRLMSVNKSGISKVDIPVVVEKPNILMSTTDSMDKISDDRIKFSGGMFQTLQDTKKIIDTIRMDYNKYIIESKIDGISDDPILKSIVGKSPYVLGIVTNQKEERVNMKILSTNMPNFKVNEIKSFTLNQDKIKLKLKLNADTLLVLQNIDGDTAKRVHVLDMWLSHVKYIINAHELIHTSRAYENQLENIGFKIENCMPVEKISRAYYKMLEIVTLFKDLIDDTPKNISCIAESPGGFIQALVDTRSKIKDNISSISISIDSDSPWKKLVTTWNKKSINITLIDKDKKITDSTKDAKKTTVTLMDGSLTSKEDRDFYIEQQGGRYMDLITADGGFGRDKSNSETEELEVAKLLIAEVSLALKMQAYNGAFVLKIFDITTQLTIDILNILSYAYEYVSIIKPAMSRKANSEKYLVCNKFKFLADSLEIREIVEKLEAILFATLPSQTYLYSILTVPDVAMQSIVVPYNNIFMKQQTEFIVRGREYATAYLYSKGDKDIIKPYIEGQLAECLRFKENFVH